MFVLPAAAILCTTFCNGVTRCHLRGIKAPAGEQDFHGDLATGCLYETVTRETLVEPRLNATYLFTGDEIRLAQDQHVRVGDLANLQLHQLRHREHLRGIDDAHDAVKTHALPKT